jgi:transglutaminase/protease-like cytokinesis protein 3
MAVIAMFVTALAPIPSSQFGVSQAQAAQTQKASSVLASLKVSPAASMNGYARSQFGSTWEDVDGNSCDTRNDILKRDLKNTTYLNTQNCLVSTGTLNDPYTGKIINFTRGATSSEVQIDHVVALGNAWATGAQLMEKSQREALANDPLNLLAVDGSANQSKGDKDASQWLPTYAKSDCSYVARQVTVKQKYSLWVTSSEKQSMSNTLASCPNEPVATATSLNTSTAAPNPSLTYRTHVQTYGWQGWAGNGQTSGTVGKAKRLEAINIKVSGRVPATSGEIQYRTHVQTYGWQGWVNTGALSGTSGKAKRLEAISIRLTSNLSSKYDVYYHVHAQHFGWLGWAKNGADAGTAGYSYRLEAIQIKLVPKGSAAPGSTASPFKQAPKKSSPAKNTKPKQPSKPAVSLPIKKAGAFCKASEKGTKARTSTGITLTCTTTATDKRLRWRH